VPDVTNNQVQINAIAPALTPVEMEKQITFQIENILAGTRRSNTRARSPATALPR
jgi:cobalt-zinc-cadmium resistance protein CzcA